MNCVGWKKLVARLLLMCLVLYIEQVLWSIILFSVRLLVSLRSDLTESYIVIHLKREMTQTVFACNIDYLRTEINIVFFSTFIDFFYSLICLQLKKIHVAHMKDCSRFPASYILGEKICALKREREKERNNAMRSTRLPRLKAKQHCSISTRLNIEFL